MAIQEAPYYRPMNDSAWQLWWNLLSQSIVAGGYDNPVTGLIVGPSPYTVSNNTKINADIVIAGGTVSQIAYIRKGVTTVLGLTGGNVSLSPGDQLQITYSAAPTVTYIPR